MRSQPRVWLVLLVALAVAASLTACNSPVKANKVQLPAPSTGTIQLTVDHSVYTSTQPIGVTVTNTTAKTTYYAVTGRSACTFLQLQEYNSKQGTWISVYGCSNVDTPVVRSIPPAASTPYTLAPGVAPASTPNVWETGIFRIALQYSEQIDGITSSQVAFSQGFQIKG